MNSVFKRLNSVMNSKFRKFKWVLFGNKEIDQIELFLPVVGRNRINYNIPNEYRLRTYRNSDESGVVDLMHSSGFTDWNSKIWQNVMYLCVPDGIFLLIENRE